MAKRKYDSEAAAVEWREVHRGWVQTRIPLNLKRWAKGLSTNPMLPYGDAAKMFTAIFVEFLDRKPYNKGFAWYETKSTVTVAGGGKEGTGYVQVNIQLNDTKLADGREVTGSQLEQIIKDEAQACNVSVATYAATAVYYLCAYKHPPKRA